MLFRHAPPIIEGSTPPSVEAGSDLSIQLSITDLDGLGDVSCTLDVIDDNNSAVWQKEFRPIESQDADGFNQMRWPVPRNLNESTDYLHVDVRCEDSDGRPELGLPVKTSQSNHMFAESIATPLLWTRSQLLLNHLPCPGS